MLYLVDKPLAELAFEIAAADDDARLVLIQDGVLVDPPPEVPTYAVEKDVDVRGVDLPDGVERIPYARLLELILEHEVKTFV